MSIKLKEIIINGTTQEMLGVAKYLCHEVNLSLRVNTEVNTITNSGVMGVVKKHAKAKLATLYIQCVSDELERKVFNLVKSEYNLTPDYVEVNYVRIEPVDDIEDLSLNKLEELTSENVLGYPCTMVIPETREIELKVYSVEAIKEISKKVAEFLQAHKLEVRLKISQKYDIMYTMQTSDNTQT